MPLDEYRRKRSADRTPEPFGGANGASVRDRGMFVIQKHAARQLHYDFRLEMEGVLRSWAVPKGPSLDPRDKRLAVMVEDHPLDYANFEGVIPQGNYGAGAVIVWDRGEYRTIDPPGDAADNVRAGKLDIEMNGFKLRGAFTLVRTRGGARGGRAGDGRQQWLLIKKRDDYASDQDVLELHPRSVLSGLTIEDMRNSGGIGAELARELERLGAPQLKAPLKADAFPVNLARLVEHPFDGEDWLFEIKYDGVRALALRDSGEVHIFGRNLTEITGRYPEIALALHAMPLDRFAFDGEIIVPGVDGRPSFQLLQRRMHVEDQATIARLSLSLPVTYYVFDLLAFANFDLRPLELEARKSLLARVVKNEGSLRYCDHVVTHGTAFFHAAAQAGLEGIVAKRRLSPYRGLRGDDWRKIKCPRLGRFVIGGWTDPAGSRAHFGALLAGQYEADGQLRFVARIGTGFDEDKLRHLSALMNERMRDHSPFRQPRGGEATIPRAAHYCEPTLVAEVQFSDWTDDGAVRHPSFKGLVEGVEARECVYEGPGKESAPTPAEAAPEPPPAANNGADDSMANVEHSQSPRRVFTPTNPDKVFWPAEGYTKKDLIDYYESIARWMLPYLKDRPVVLTRYPDGIDGKSFFQKDAPGFAPDWIRTEKIYSEDSRRDISYFILESAEALGYIANLGAIPIHMWSSRLPHLERPDWLLFDIDPKGTTTRQAVVVAREVGAVLSDAGMRPYVKSSGQKGIHVMVGLIPEYTYEQARMFAELVARIVTTRLPEAATLIREVSARKGRAYIDYLQLGHGKTIAAPYAVRPIAGAPVSAPLSWTELKPSLTPVKYNIKTMPRRMARLKRDPFLGVLTDLQRLEPSLPKLEAARHGG